MIIQPQKQGSFHDGSTDPQTASSDPASHTPQSSQMAAVNQNMVGAQPVSAGTGLKRSHTAPGAILTASQSPLSCSLVKYIATQAYSDGSTQMGATSADGDPSPKIIKLENPHNRPSTDSGPSPKIIKPENPCSKDTKNYRKYVCTYKRQKMREIKKRYKEHLTELFYLQGGGNIMEFPSWKSQPTQSLLSFLESSKLESEEEEEDETQEKSVEEEKLLSRVGSSTQSATPVTSSTELPLLPTANQAVISSTSAASNTSRTPEPSIASSELQQYLVQDPDTKFSIGRPGISFSQTAATQNAKSLSLSPGRSRQLSSSSLQDATQAPSADIVERAKLEAHVIQRVNELRKEGMWSSKRLPRVQEPPRHETHWDYLLREMTWLATDYIQERKWKKAVARKIAWMVANHVREREEQTLRQKKEEAERLKKIASHMAKIVQDFWASIEQIVQYKQLSGSFKGKVPPLDVRIRDNAGLVKKCKQWSSHTESHRASSDEQVSPYDSEEFEVTYGSSKDVEAEKAHYYASKDDALVDEVQGQGVVSDDVLKTLPKEMFDKPSSSLNLDDGSDSEVSLLSQGDGSCNVGFTEEVLTWKVVEDKKNKYSRELDNLKAEANLSIEELKKGYPGAFDPDLDLGVNEFNEYSGNQTDSQEELESSLTEDTYQEEDDPEDSISGVMSPADRTFMLNADLGLVEMSKEFSDLLSQTESLQCHEHTLDAAKVRTRVPFLLKQALRDYQCIGLDWLARLHDQSLNGVLADEAGLGKTVQAIAFMAHLACEKGMWGPHLIVVPASSLHHWEVELNKWCPALKVVTYTGSKRERRIKRKDWTKKNACHVCLTSYNVALEDHRVLSKRKWQYFILEEAQNIVHDERWQSLLLLSRCQRRLLLKGSSIQDNVEELWSVLRFLFPSLPHQVSQFSQENQEKYDCLVNQLKKILAPFLLRRSRNDVTYQLPQKTEYTINCQLTGRQIFLYNTILSQARTKETLATDQLIKVLLQLKKVCNHPNLVCPQSVVSPFKMDGISYSTASAATHVLDCDPLDTVDMHSLYPSLAEMDTDLPNFVAWKVKNSKLSGRLIEELGDTQGQSNRVPNHLQGNKCQPALSRTDAIGSSSSALSLSSVSLQKSSSPASANQKPVMRVLPFLEIPSVDFTLPSLQESIPSEPASSITVEKSLSAKPDKKPSLFLESLFQRKEKRSHVTTRRHRILMRHHSIPACGGNIQQLVDCMQLSDKSTYTSDNRSVTNTWSGVGYVNCLIAQDQQLNHSHPDVYWRESHCLPKLVCSDWKEEFKNTISMFAPVIPSVISPGVSMHTLHPDPAFLSQFRTFHLASTQPREMLAFPDVHHLKNSCGKLQKLDVMLRELKSGQHKVVIFTQMTKMMDILEAYLSSHGHSYLRVDGTAKVFHKQYLVDSFNADPRIFCLIMSTRSCSGSVASNLPNADTVIFYDNDWLSTMDDMTSEWCNRLSLTRNLNVYRFVTEGTIEGNTIKKWVWKHSLASEGEDMANSHLNEEIILGLLGTSSKTESLGIKAEEHEAHHSIWHSNTREIEDTEDRKTRATVLSQFERTLLQVEDEADAQAADHGRELDEERLSDERDSNDEDEEENLPEAWPPLLEELAPIQRYAAHILEAQKDLLPADPHSSENDIQRSKISWELARLKAKRDEEEKKAMLEDDEMFTYSKDISQIFVSDTDGAEMPIWCPPTPPQDDNDIYIDESMAFLYEHKLMSEQALPPVYVPKGLKKLKMEAVTTRKQKQRREDQPRVPRSLFDKPKEVVMKLRRDAKLQRLRQNFQVPAKIITGRVSVHQHLTSPAPVLAKSEPDPSYPEWLVHEDWALLEAVQHIQKLNPDVLIENPAQIINWDFVSDYVSTVSRIFRASKHCKYQYENVILPREDGRLLYSFKQRKTPKSIYKTKSSRPLRTEQLYCQEGLRNFSQLFDIRFAAMKEIGTKRPVAKQTIVSAAAKPAKQTAILGEHGINYDFPMTPGQLAARRAERIALDKRKQQQAAVQAQAVTANTAAVDAAAALPQRLVQPGTAAASPTTPAAIPGQQISSIVSVTPTSQVPKLAVGPGLATVSITRTLGAAAAGNIIVNAPAGLQASPFAAINKRVSQAVGLPNAATATSTALTPAIRGQRPQTPSTPTITMQNLAVATTTASTSPTITVAAHQTISAATAAATPPPTAGQKPAALTTVGTTTIQPQLVQAARSLTPHQINILRQNQSIVRAAGLQQLRAQTLLTTEQLNAQQLKHPTQKVITQQLLVPVRGQSILQGKQALLRASAKMTEEQLKALRMRTQVQAQPDKQIQATQIIQGQVAAAGQTSVPTSQTPITLVKSVVSAAPVVAPVTNQLSGLSVPQQRAATAASRTTTVNPIQRVQLLQQQRKAGTQQKVTGLATGKASPIPLLIPQHSKLLSSNQFLHQIGLVSLTTGSQTITPGTPITVTHVSPATTPGVGLTLARQGGVKTATITSIDGGAAAAIQVQPGQRSVVGLSQGLVGQVQQTSAQVSQFLQVSPLTVQAQSPAPQTQQATVTLPASLVSTAAARRATPTPPGVTPRPQTPAQISLITTSVPQSVVSTIATVQVQCNPSAEEALSAQILAQNVPAPAAVATIVTQTSQPDPTQAAAAGGQKSSSQHTMKTRNTRHLL